MSTIVIGVLATLFSGLAAYGWGDVWDRFLMRKEPNVRQNVRLAYLSTAITAALIIFTEMNK